jgi:hypothetical protein
MLITPAKGHDYSNSSDPAHILAARTYRKIVAGRRCRQAGNDGPNEIPTTVLARADEVIE